MRRWLVTSIVALALVLILGRWASTVYAEWQWYDAMGALPLFRSALTHQLAWRVGAFAVAFAFAFLNLYALRRSIVSLVLPRRMGNIEIGEAVSPRLLLTFVAISSGVMGILLSAPTGDWTTFALARIAEPFREMDPYLDRDLSFVMADLPFEFDLYEWAGRTMLVIALLIVVLYALTPSLRLRRGGLYVSAWCRRHFSVLAALGILLLAWRWRLDELTVTTLPADAIHGFGAYAQKVGMPFLGWLAVLTAVLAFVVFWAGWHGHGRVVAAAGLVAAAGGPLAKASLPALTLRVSSTREQQEADRPYEATGVRFMRRAFGVDEIVLRAPGGRGVGVGSLASAIPAWDPAALARTVAPVATSDVHPGVAWSASPGALRATVVSGHRGGSRAWGAAAFDPTVADERGRALPALPTEPGTSSVANWADLLVFPGATAVAVVDDSTGHLPAPGFGTTIERVSHAWNQRSPRLLAAERLPVRPRIVFERDVAERVKALAPFLLLGPSITPLVRGDSLYWVAELYTTARFYPLTRRLMFAGEFRPYVHHAATAFVHAGTGRVTMVAGASPDAVLRTWIRRFPTLFVSPSAVSAELWNSRPPLADWAALQATALARTGADDRLPVARLSLGNDNADADLLAAGPGFYGADLERRQLGWAVPIVNSAGAVAGAVARTTGAVGETTWIPSNREDRWSDVLDRLQRAADSAGAGRQRRSPRRGHVMTIPTTEGLVYVQAHYDWPTDAAPVLTGVAAMRGGVVRAGPTISDALGMPTPVGTAPGAFRASVDALHRRMGEALRRGDWAAFGSAFSALGQLLRGGGR
jgi:uncharacterized membrane protein (UPF0182 family)